MKVTIEFEENEDEQKIETLLRAFKYRQSLEDIYEYIRNRMKYTDISAESYDELDKLRDFLHEVISANDSPINV